LIAGYLKHRARAEGLSTLLVESRGLLGIEGERADPHARQVARENGFDLDGHRSAGLRPSDVRSADLVLAMTLDHVDELRRRFPGDAPPILLIRAFEADALPRGGAPDVPDPIGGPIEAFRESFRIVKPCVDHLVLHLKHLP
jgi:protein-tyrosine phosphatase